MAEHIKINKDLIEAKLSELNIILEDYEVYRNRVTQYIFDNEKSFEGAAGKSFRNKFIEVNVIATDSMNIIKQYLETFNSYHDYIADLDDNLSKDIDGLY